MYGMADAFFEGRITSDVQLRQTDSGRSYCYFSIAINPRPITDRETGKKIEQDADFFNLSANGGAAEIIAKHAKKGTIFIGWTTPKPQKHEKKEKDGATTVYRDMVFRVRPGQFDLVESAVSGKGEPSAPAGYTPPPRQPGPEPPAAEPGYEEPDAEDSLARSLPF